MRCSRVFGIGPLRVPGSGAAPPTRGMAPLEFATAGFVVFTFSGFMVLGLTFVAWWAEAFFCSAAGEVTTTFSGCSAIAAGVASTGVAVCETSGANGFTSTFAGVEKAK